jgi:hypothetical protein
VGYKRHKSFLNKQRKVLTFFFHDAQWFLSRAALKLKSVRCSCRRCGKQVSPGSADKASGLYSFLECVLARWGVVNLREKK